MRAAWMAWKRSWSLVWEHAIRLIVINLLWAATSFLVITAGPATLAAYWFIANHLRDGSGEAGYSEFFHAMRRFFVRGVIWLGAWALLVWLAWAGLAVYGQLLPPLGVAVVQVFWLYGLLYLAAMQPYLLEAITIGEKPWAPAIKESAWQVLANPIYSHIHLLIPAVAAVLAAKFITLWAIVLGALVLAFWAGAAAGVPWRYGQPKPVERRMEDVL